MGEEVDFDSGSEFGSNAIDEFSKKPWNVEALEEEMRKIEGFRRQLPNCMHLLQHAIERLKESEREMGEDGRVKESNDLTDKKNWMSSVRLWSTPLHFDITRNQHSSVLHLKSGYDKCNFGNRAGAFLPFKKEGTAPIDGFPEAEAESSVEGDSRNGRPKLQQPHLLEQQRKQRRCWSPDLHKRFVDALHHLGGPHKATPKQIRELMRVDGLTNDEVKSHLQKYRIHIKKLPNAAHGDLSKPMAMHSGSPQGPLRGGRAARGGGDSTEEHEEDDKSESHDLPSIVRYT